jgi:hypothetical protein
MRSVHLLRIICLSIYISSCISSSEQEAIEVIKKSIKAHGGQDQWEGVEIISLQKETQLFLEDGEIESRLKQNLELRRRPFLSCKISWEKDSMIHLLTFDGLKTRYRMGQSEIQNHDFLISKKKELDAAFYVLTKPFDLLDGSKQLEYIGLTKLPI